MTNEQTATALLKEPIAQLKRGNELPMQRAVSLLYSRGMDARQIAAVCKCLGFRASTGAIQHMKEAGDLLIINEQIAKGVKA